MRLAGYVRVSTDEQRESGAGIEAQRAAISREADQRGWEIVRFFDDSGYSARDLKRPGIQVALSSLTAGEADALMVSKLDRLSRSMLDFTALMARASRDGWAIVALDCAVDTTTPAGEAMANVLATFAQFERRLIGQRTREALREKRRAGVRLGRPPAISEAVAARIRSERAAGASLRRICTGLNGDGVGTPHGGSLWRPSSLERVLART